MPVESAEAYSKACTRTLEVLAANSYHIDWETALYTVATCLTDMSHLLNVANLVRPLTPPSHWCSGSCDTDTIIDSTAQPPH